MKKLLYIFFLITSHFALAQSKNEPPPPISFEKDRPTITEKKEEPQETYFHFYKDFNNYILEKECKYKSFYEKYATAKHTPIKRKIIENRDSLPPPCYKINGDSVEIGMHYKYMFLLMMDEKKIFCKKDGSGYYKDFYILGKVTHSLYKSVNKAFELLQKNENNPYTEKGKDSLFEEAKTYFRKGDYVKSNAIFAFLGTIDERYLEASLNNVGLSFYNQKDKNALDFFEKAIELYPKGYLGYLNAGACWVNLPVYLGDDDKSGYYFKKAYELAPNNPNAIFNYANVLNQCAAQGVDIQDLKENLFAQAVQLKQNEPLFKLQYAKTLHQKALDNSYNEEYYTSALNAYDEAIKIFPDYADNYKYKAKLLSRWGREKNYPENRIMRKKVCENLDKYKSLLKSDYDKDLDRLCTNYPQLKTDYLQNYTELLNGWEEISIAKGDLNKDGHEDIAIIVREINPEKIKNIVRYNTPNHERGMKNYNESSLYILLYNPQQNNYLIKEINDKILSVGEGYYDKIFEVQIKNGTFRLLRHENPESGKFTRIFRLEDDEFMCIGENLSLVKDKVGNISDAPNMGLTLPIEKYNISYNFNTNTLEISTPNKQKTTYQLDIVKYGLRNAENNDYKVFREAKKIIKNYP